MRAGDGGERIDRRGEWESGGGGMMKDRAERTRLVGAKFDAGVGVNGDYAIANVAVDGDGIAERIFIAFPMAHITVFYWLTIVCITGFIRVTTNVITIARVMISVANNAMMTMTHDTITNVVRNRGL